MVRFFTDEKEKKNGDVGNHKHRKLYDYYSSGAIVSGARSSPQNIAVKAQHAERWNNKMKKMNEGIIDLKNEKNGQMLMKIESNTIET